MEKFTRLKEIVAENLGCDVNELTEDTHLVEDLKADSLDMVELSMAVEEEFDMSFTDEELQEIRTIGDMKAYLKDE